MADTKVTVGIDLEDDLTPKLNEVNKAFHTLGESSKEAGFWGKQFEELTAGIGYQVGLWNVGFMATSKAIEAVGAAIHSSLTKEFETVKFENLTHGIANVNELLSETKKIADATNQSFKDVTEQRFTLEQAGVSYGAQALPLQISGQMAAITGESAEKMTEMMAHIKEGTANEKEMLYVASLINPQMEGQLQSLRDQEVLYPQIIRHMEHEEMIMTRQKTLADRAYEDQRAIAQVRQTYDQRLGITQAAFKEKYRDVDPGYYNKEELAERAAYGRRQEFQQKFSQGQQQLQKELGYSSALMTDMINSGVIGAQDLMEANQRAEDKRKQNSDRAFQDVQQANAAKREEMKFTAEETKLNLMQQQRDALFDQVEAQKTLNDLTEKYNKEQGTAIGHAQKVGREIQGAGEDAGSFLKTIGDLGDALINMVPLKDRFKGQQPWERPGHPITGYGYNPKTGKWELREPVERPAGREPEHPSPSNLDEWMRWKLGQQPKPSQPGENPAKESTLQKALEEFIKANQMLMKVFSTS